MATATDFPKRNDYLGKPSDMTDTQCYALPICRMLTFIPGETEKDPPQRVHAHVSFWKFTNEEIDEIVRTRGAYLKVIGTTTYPLSLHGLNPIHPGGAIGDYVFNAVEILQLHGKANEG